MRVSHSFLEGISLGGKYFLETSCPHCWLARLLFSLLAPVPGRIILNLIMCVYIYSFIYVYFLNYVCIYLFLLVHIWKQHIHIYIYNICLFIYIFIVIFQVYRHKQLTWCIVNADIQSTAARTWREWKSVMCKSTVFSPTACHRRRLLRCKQAGKLWTWFRMNLGSSETLFSGTGVDHQQRLSWPWEPFWKKPAHT